MDQNKQQIIERLGQATNVLVTVSANPSVDQLAACIGLTLFLNKLGKHATAVFSGQAPSTIEFLEPETTLEQNTDSLRDFIISLDKAKADKLRYKVEENIVKIFITPYRTSLSDADLNFSQGDFNVEAVIALGVKEKEDLDQAIVAHGRILHDATVISVNTGSVGALGSINWSDPTSSSLCEMVTSIADSLKKDSYDNQIATALLTGIVAETERFSNEKTSPNTMTLAAALMAAGANQQLIATKLQAPVEVPETVDVNPEGPPQEVMVSEDGTLSIDHPDESNSPPQEEAVGGEDLPDIHIDEHGNMNRLEDVEASEAPAGEELSRPAMILEPPSRGGTLTANDKPEELAGSSDAMSTTEPLESILQHTDVNPEPTLEVAVVEEDPLSTTPLEPLQPQPAEGSATEPEQVIPETPVSQDLPRPEDILAASSTTDQVDETPVMPEITPLEPIQTESSSEPSPLVLPNHDSAADTLSDLEKAVDSLHIEPPDPNALSLPAPDELDARSAVENALNASPDAPLESLNAQPLSDGSLHAPDLTTIEPTPIADILAQADAEVTAPGVGSVTDPTLPPALPPPLTIMPPIPGETGTQTPPTNPLFNQPQ